MEKVIQNLIKMYGTVLVRKASYNENITEVVYYCHTFCKSDKYMIEDAGYTIFCKDGKLEVTLFFYENNN
jgi:hypothetical protein